MRRLFIIRKDLHLTAGKLAAMVSHCAEAYWLNLLKNFATQGRIKDNEYVKLPTEVVGDPDYWTRYRNPAIYEAAKAAHERGEKVFKYPAENQRKTYSVGIELQKDIWNDYVNDIFTKTVCEAKNLNHLMKVVDIAKEIGLQENVDYGFIDDCCKTELTPEFTDENGNYRCRVGIWFRPLPDEISKQLSKKYQIYKG